MIGQALERLASAMRSARVPIWDPPESIAIVDELESEIAPARLPSEVREFWNLVDVTTLRVIPYPRFRSPEIALDGWRMARDEKVFWSVVPRALLAVGYESHVSMSVELDVGEGSGGALFYSVEDEPDGFERLYNSLGDWVADLADLIESGFSERVETDSGPYLRVPGHSNRHDAAKRRRLPSSHPRYGEVTHIGQDSAGWPDHWLW